MPTSNAQKKASKKYTKENYENLMIRVRKGNRAKVKDFAESQGKSLNAFVKDLISKEMNEQIE